jgi:hypothetical protein
MAHGETNIKKIKNKKVCYIAVLRRFLVLH